MERVMEKRNKPLSNPHHSTVDLLSWSEIRHPDYSAVNCSNQPSDGICKVLGGGAQTTNAEAESLNKKKNCSGHKLKEMTGSDIFSDNGKDDPNHNSRIHYHQDQHSQISFGGQENSSTKKPLTVQTEADSKSKKKKQISNTKTKAIHGHDDIFASPLPPESQTRCFKASTQQEDKGNKNMEESTPRNLRASVKASNVKSGNRLFSEERVVKSSRKIHNLKFQELTSNGIFKCDKVPPGYSEKFQSSAKLREMKGHNIFADGKSEYRDYYGGARRPPGGESSISLV